MARDPAALARYLTDLQGRLCAALEAADGRARFDRRHLPGERGGEARPCVLEEGAVLERAAVNYSHTRGERLPPAASAARPALAGAPFEALSLSLIVHPHNPHAPTVHMNLRRFEAHPPGAPALWWVGGGFDLTPTYGYAEDAEHWHRNALAAVGAERYAEFKAACDRYFWLPHRGEARGVGGLFFDDWRGGGPAEAFALLRAVGEAFLPGYLPLLERRAHQPFTAAQRAFQRYRRGRYAEFNLLYDRGTRHGLEAGGRTESILASLPPAAEWRYDWRPAPDTPEAHLAAEFLTPREWVRPPAGRR